MRNQLALLIACVLGWCWSAAGQGVAPETLDQGFIIVVQDKSGLVGPESPLYLASNHGNWNPGNPILKLTGRSDGRWQIGVPKPDATAPMEFKFTRGSWDTVEVAADLSDLPNRRLAAMNAASIKAGEPPLIELTIEKFVDQRTGTERKSTDPYRTLAVTGMVRRVQVFGGGTPLVAAREVLVWLPPGYFDRPNATRRYPVLYLMDGQNIFEQQPGVPGEWRADESATDLIQKGEIEPLIIVGVPNAGQWRTAEYSPIAALKDVSPLGEPFVAWLLAEVRPRVERSFRVAEGPERTAIGGASLGGLIALYAATRHPDVFGAALVESPALLLGSHDAVTDLFTGIPTWPRRIFIAMGGKETSGENAIDINRRLVDAATRLDSVAATAGATHQLTIDPEATHNENAWAARFPQALRFLFPAPK